MNKRPIAHVEIPAASRPEAAQFYHEAFGWDCQSVEEMHYTTFQSGNIRGGFPNIDHMQYRPGDVILYVESSDIEADLKQIEKLGGKVLSEKMEVPGVGSYAFFADPSGNRLAFWKANRA